MHMHLHWYIASEILQDICHFLSILTKVKKLIGHNTSISLKNMEDRLLAFCKTNNERLLCPTSKIYLNF